MFKSAQDFPTFGTAVMSVQIAGGAVLRLSDEGNGCYATTNQWSSQPAQERPQNDRTGVDEFDYV